MQAAPRYKDNLLRFLINQGPATDGPAIISRMGLLITTTGKPLRIFPSNGERFTDEEIRGYLCGQYEPHAISTRHIMYVKKNAALLGDAFNEFATKLAFWLKPGDIVQGTAIICNDNEKIFIQ